MIYEERDKEKREERAEERRKRQIQENLKTKDVTKHLMTAIVSLLGREFEAEEEDDNFRDLLDTAKTAIMTAYNLPEEDESLAVPRKLENIFLRDVRYDVKIEEGKSEDIKDDIDEEKMDEDVRNNDNDSFEKQENDLDNNTDLQNSESMIESNQSTNNLITSTEGTTSNENMPLIRIMMMIDLSTSKYVDTIQLVFV